MKFKLQAESIARREKREKKVNFCLMNLSICESVQLKIILGILVTHQIT